MLTKAEETLRTKLYGVLSKFKKNPGKKYDEAAALDKLMQLETKDIITDDKDVWATIFDDIKIDISTRMGIDVFSDPELEAKIDETLTVLMNKLTVRDLEKAGK
jgi:hypothetical protein